MCRRVIKGIAGKYCILAHDTKEMRESRIWRLKVLFHASMNYWRLLHRVAGFFHLLDFPLLKPAVVFRRSDQTLSAASFLVYKKDSILILIQIGNTSP